jgi:hypothetical protein
MKAISRKKSTHIGELSPSYGEEPKAPTYIFPCGMPPYVLGVEVALP